MQRRAGYTEELFMDDSGEKPVIKKPLEGSKIKKSEVRAAITKMERNKATGPDNICIESIQALEDFGVEKNNRHPQ